MEENSQQITQLLNRWSNGDAEVLDNLMPLVYEELRRQASGYLRRERSNHTLQPTALINEAYLKLIDQRDVKWQNRAHFLQLRHKLCAGFWLITRVKESERNAEARRRICRSMKP